MPMKKATQQRKHFENVCTSEEYNFPLLLSTDKLFRVHCKVDLGCVDKQVE
jgi:hypothetical protein